jgi:5-methylcytosine-specific restriction endonuclease McrA
MKRPAVAARRRAYKERTKEARYARNREYMTEYNKTEQQRERNRNYMREYYKRLDKKKATLRARQYRSIHGEHLRAADRQRYQENKARYKFNAAQRRVRYHNAAGTHILAQWLDRIAAHCWRCFYCKRTGVKLTKDHAIPLSRGGTNWPSNLIPACQHCNGSKQDKTWAEFKETLKWQ